MKDNWFIPFYLQHVLKSHVTVCFTVLICMTYISVLYIHKQKCFTFIVINLKKRECTFKQLSQTCYWNTAGQEVMTFHVTKTGLYKYIHTNPCCLRKTWCHPTSAMIAHFVIPNQSFQGTAVSQTCVEEHFKIFQLLYFITESTRGRQTLTLEFSVRETFSFIIGNTHRDVWVWSRGHSHHNCILIRVRHKI